MNLNHELESRIAADWQKVQEQDSAGLAAAAEPLPGPLKNALFPHAIMVGKYYIRPFTDRDFEVLGKLRNPLIGLLSKMLSKQEVKEDEISTTVLRGESAWEAAWVLSRFTPRESYNMLLDPNGQAKLKTLAADEFGDYPIGFVTSLVLAVWKQMGESCTTIVGYGSAAEGEKSDPPK